jgi:hypothetical protein
VAAPLLVVAAACSSTAKYSSSTASSSRSQTTPSSAQATLASVTAAARGCPQVAHLLTAEQSAIRGLRNGSQSEPAAESTITGINGRLAQAYEDAGRSSILGITIEQLVSENGLLSEALDQSIPVANLGSVFSTVQQDITNIQGNCHS